MSVAAFTSRATKVVTSATLETLRRIVSGLAMPLRIHIKVDDMTAGARASVKMRGESLHLVGQQVSGSGRNQGIPYAIIAAHRRRSTYRQGITAVRRPGVPVARLQML